MLLNTWHLHLILVLYLVATGSVYYSRSKVGLGFFFSFAYTTSPTAVLPGQVLQPEAKGGVTPTENLES